MLYYTPSAVIALNNKDRGVNMPKKNEKPLIDDTKTGEGEQGPAAGAPEPVEFDARAALGDAPRGTEGASEPPAPPPSEDTNVNKRARSKRRAKRKTSPARPSAEMVVGGLDMMREAIGGLPTEKRDPVRVSCVEAWERYFEETGKEPPAWAVCAVVSVSYVAPAFVTEQGKGFAGRIWGGVKAKIAAWKAKRA